MEKSHSLLAAICVVVIAVRASLYDAEANRDVEQYRERVNILHDILISEGCTDPEKRDIRENSLTSDRLDLEAELKLYEKLKSMIIECRKLKLSTSVPPSVKTATSKPTTSPTQSTTTTIAPTTTAQPLPIECQRAINLTDAVRLQHKGNTASTGLCDTRRMINEGRPWFRFAGAAGTMLLNTCPALSGSCGTAGAIWSNATMPTAVGQAKTITVFSSANAGCTQNNFKASVLRCSDNPSDFVYRYDGREQCNDAFCGMRP